MTKARDILAEIQLSRAQGAEEQRIELLPPLNNDELRRLEAQIPCRLPDDPRELFRYARGFRVRHPVLHGAHRRLSDVDLSGLDGEFGLEQVFPHALSIADDGCGNFWVIDLTRDSRLWGPILYACHDPAVVVYQAHDIAGFIEDVFSADHKLEAIQKAAGNVWWKNPAVVTYEECADSSDEDLKRFARSLDASYEFIDLRNPKPGDGFSWGRYGPWTVNKRFGEKRIFACQTKTKWQRLTDSLWRRS